MKISIIYFASIIYFCFIVKVNNQKKFFFLKNHASINETANMANTLTANPCGNDENGILLKFIPKIPPITIGGSINVESIVSIFINLLDFNCILDIFSAYTECIESLQYRTASFKYTACSHKSS